MSAIRYGSSYLIIGTFGAEGMNDRYPDTLALYEAAKTPLTEDAAA